MVQQAKYQVLKQIDKVEIRKYSAMLLARVDGQSDGGFNILYQYITGKNTKKSSVEMTAPVVSEKISMTAPVVSENRSLAFIMPEEYTAATIPQPLDNSIQIVEVPPRTVAALTFSGRWSDSVFQNKSKELLETLTKANITTVGEVFYLRYNGPFAPWFMRRNEVAIQIEQSTQAM
jgi:hypothetical protein